jgi:hypothetical protein
MSLCSAITSATLAVREGTWLDPYRDETMPDPSHRDSVYYFLIGVNHKICLNKFLIEVNHKLCLNKLLIEERQGLVLVFRNA